MKKLNSKAKKILLVIVAVVLVAAIGAGVFFGVRGKAEPVGVYSFQYLGMTEYWGDSQESYGPVTTDKIQTIYLSDTQTVTEILVSAGDPVKKGDLLMTFDTTLSDISLERERLNVEKLKLQLQDAKTELQKIREMQPMVIPEFEESEEVDESELGTKLKDPYKVSTSKEYDGSSRAKALICWLNTSSSIDDDVLEAIRVQAEKFQNANAQKEASSASDVPEEFSEDPPAPSGDDPDPSEDPPAPSEDDPDPSEDEPEPSEDPPAPSEDDPEPSEDPPAPSEDDPEPSEDPPAPSEDEPDPSEDVPEPSEDDPEPSEDPPAPSEDEPEPSEDIPEPSEDVPEPSEEPEVEYVTVTDFYVVFKTTAGNMSLGERSLWQGMHVYQNEGGSFRFNFFDAYTVPDHMVIGEDGSAEDVSQPEIDYGSGYTAAQISQMRVEQEKKIKELEFDIQMAEADYKIMQLEVQDGNVYATIDGEVVSVLTEEEAKLNQQPIVKVSGGGGFYVEGSVSELEKENLKPGQEVTINDWRNGGTYTGEVTAIGNFPSSDNGWNGMGNPNASYYPFTVFVDGTADLQAGSYVSVTYSTSSSENGIYLENPFIRTEQGRSFVYVLGKNGTLEKRDVVTGKSLWGSYTEIISGITEEDMIAFPYGKNVKEGAPAEERDIADLYSY